MFILDFTTKDNLDKVSPPWKGNFYQLISLWEIIMRNSVRAWGSILDALGSYREEIICYGEDYLTEDERYKLDRWLRAAVEESQLLGLSGSIREIGRAQSALKREAAPKIAQALENASRRILDDLQSVMFLHIKPECVRYYDERQLFGEGLFKPLIADKLPLALEDIGEAGKCFALNRYTACVFHLMRVMEYTVQRFGKKLKAKLKKDIKDESWYNILKAINEAIKLMPDTTARQKDKIDKYSTISAYLNNVRIAWRNKVMHPKQTYTKEEAEDVIYSVRIFVNDLAEIL